MCMDWVAGNRDKIWFLEIYGGHGYMKELGVETLVRDAASVLHGDGVNRTFYLKAANFIFPK